MTIGISTAHSAPIPIRTQFAEAARYYPVDLGARHVASMDRLQTRCGTENVVPRSAAYYASHFADGHKAIGMVDSQGQLVAHALIRNAGKRTKMLNVLVDPEHRGQKLHAHMIKEWLEDACKAGFRIASARVRPCAVASFKNFSAAGFESVRMEPSPDAPNEMTHVMVKKLAVRGAPHLTLVE